MKIILSEENVKSIILKYLSNEGTIGDVEAYTVSIEHYSLDDFLTIRELEVVRVVND